MNYTKISSQSKQKIKEILLKDYQNQLKKLQETPKQYKEYRKKYLLLKNRIMQVKKGCENATTLQKFNW